MGLLEDCENDYIVCGNAKCPLFAKAERLANLCLARLPCIKILISSIHPNDFKNHLKHVCMEYDFQHFYSPLIYTGSGRLVGGLEEFSHRIFENYGLEVDIQKLTRLQMVASENVVEAASKKVRSQVMEYLNRRNEKISFRLARIDENEKHSKGISVYRKALAANKEIFDQAYQHLLPLVDQPDDPNIYTVTEMDIPVEACEKLISLISDLEAMPTDDLPDVAQVMGAVPKANAKGRRASVLLTAQPIDQMKRASRNSTDTEEASTPRARKKLERTDSPKGPKRGGRRGSIMARNKGGDASVGQNSLFDQQSQGEDRGAQINSTLREIESFTFGLVMYAEAIGLFKGKVVEVFSEAAVTRDDIPEVETAHVILEEDEDNDNEGGAEEEKPAGEEETPEGEDENAEEVVEQKEKVPMAIVSRPDAREIVHNLKRFISEFSAVYDNVVKLAILKNFERKKLQDQIHQFQKFIDDETPKWLLSEAHLEHSVRYIQSLWRGYKARRRTEELDWKRYEQLVFQSQKEREKRFVKFELDDIIPGVGVRVKEEE